MNSRIPNLLYASVPRPDLAKVLRGERQHQAVQSVSSGLIRQLPSETLVFWQESNPRPCIVCVADQEREEFFAWLFTYQRDLSPISSWCHVLSTKDVENFVGGGSLIPDLLGLEAAWAGAIVAEAIVLTGRTYETVSLPVCLATDTFAIARMASLYGPKSAMNDAIERMDRVRDKLKRPPERWRPGSSLTTSVLLRLLSNSLPATTQIQRTLVECCKLIAEQSIGDRDPRSMETPLRSLIREYPKLDLMKDLEEMPAERRVRALREFPVWINNSREDQEREAFSFAAGYLISRVGGAERDLRLAEPFGALYPQVLTWAAILGGLGVTAYWSDAFGGIGRLVARELSRSLSLLDAPSADVSSDELLVISSPDGKLPKIRTASNQAASVSLRPGVNIQFSLLEEDRQRRAAAMSPPARPSYVRQSSVPVQAPQSGERNHLQTLAEQLFPFLKELFEKDTSDPRSGRKSKSPRLPFKD